MHPERSPLLLGALHLRGSNASVGLELQRSALGLAVCSHLKDQRFRAGAGDPWGQSGGPPHAPGAKQLESANADGTAGRAGSDLDGSLRLRPRQAVQFPGAVGQCTVLRCLRHSLHPQQGGAFPGQAEAVCQTPALARSWSVSLTLLAKQRHVDICIWLNWPVQCVLAAVLIRFGCCSVLVGTATCKAGTLHSSFDPFGPLAGVRHNGGCKTGPWAGLGCPSPVSQQGATGGSIQIVSSPLLSCGRLRRRVPPAPACIQAALSPRSWRVSQAPGAGRWAGEEEEVGRVAVAGRKGCRQRRRRSLP